MPSANVPNNVPNGTPTVPTMTQSGQRVWLYPDRRPGRHASHRKNIAIVLLIIYLVTPWLTIGGRPLLRIDITAGVAYVFGLVFHTNDTSILAFFFASMALILFLATAIRGRIWCGYACPQTIFVEWVIRPIEEFIEGPAHRRRIADRGEKNLRLVVKKIAKHSIFLLVSAVVANTFLGYFIPWEKLTTWMTHSPSEHPAAFGIMSVVLIAFYADLSWFREQFCAFLCPYARFQSVMFDSDTPAVAYDYHRGEPRGRNKCRGDLGSSSGNTQQAGDCIDCGLCQRVCPTGIDIRNGVQLECIMCARCIDACDSIMDNLGRKKGLIRLASEREINRSNLSSAHWPANWNQARSLLRPRVIFYSAALLFVAGLAALRLSSRPQLAMTLTRPPGAAYSRFPDGQLGNLFNLRMINNTSSSLKMTLEITTPKQARLICGPCNSGTLEPFAEKVVPVVIQFSPEDVGHGGNEQLVLRSTATSDKVQSALLAPVGVVK